LTAVGGGSTGALLPLFTERGDVTGFTKSLKTDPKYWARMSILNGVNILMYL